MGSEIINLPNEIIQKMKQHPEINWEELISYFIQSYTDQLDLHEANKLAKNSELTEETALELSRLIEKSAWEKFQKKMSSS